MVPPAKKAGIGDLQVGCGLRKRPVEASDDPQMSERKERELTCGSSVGYRVPIKDLLGFQRPVINLIFNPQQIRDLVGDRINAGQRAGK